MGFFTASGSNPESCIAWKRSGHFSLVSFLWNSSSAPFFWLLVSQCDNFNNTTYVPNLPLPPDQTKNSFSWDLAWHFALPCFASPSHLEVCFLTIVPSIRHISPNSCLKVCFYGTQPKKMHIQPSSFLVLFKYSIATTIFLTHFTFQFLRDTC